MGKRQVSFFIDNDLFKRFSKKCIDIEKSKTDVLVDLIEDFVK
ncbi:MAG: hypothetical protein U9O94_03870 [Nanoarchaeota archaeon]|nr:hypothetical protein [Nanoarchaeota archaeon]